MAVTAVATARPSIVIDEVAVVFRGLRLLLVGNPVGRIVDDHVDDLVRRGSLAEEDTVRLLDARERAALTSRTRRVIGDFEAPIPGVVPVDSEAAEDGGA